MSDQVSCIRTLCQSSCQAAFYLMACMQEARNASLQLAAHCRADQCNRRTLQEWHRLDASSGCKQSMQAVKASSRCMQSMQAVRHAPCNQESVSGVFITAMQGRTHMKKEDSLSKPYATARCRLDGTVKTKNWCALAIALIREEGPVTHPICIESALSVCAMYAVHQTHIAQQQAALCIVL